MNDLEKRIADALRATAANAPQLRVADDLHTSTAHPSSRRRWSAPFAIVAAVTLLIVGTVLLVGHDGPATDAPVAGDGTREVTVYLLDTSTGALVPRTVMTPDTGDAAVDALTALLSQKPTENGTGVRATNPLTFLQPGDQVITKVRSVVASDGVATVDLADPFPTAAYTCNNVGYCPTGSDVVNQLVWTVAAALGTDDPVLFTADGDPMTAIFGRPLNGPVAPDPAALEQAELVTVPDVAGRSVEEAKRILASAGLSAEVEPTACAAVDFCRRPGMVVFQRPVPGTTTRSDVPVVLSEYDPGAF